MVMLSTHRRTNIHHSPFAANLERLTALELAVTFCFEVTEIMLAKRVVLLLVAMLFAVLLARAITDSWWASGVSLIIGLIMGIILFWVIIRQRYE